MNNARSAGLESSFSNFIMGWITDRLQDECVLEMYRQGEMHPELIPLYSNYVLENLRFRTWQHLLPDICAKDEN